MTFKTMPNRCSKTFLRAGIMSTLAALGIAGCSSTPPQDVVKNAITPSNDGGKTGAEPGTVKKTTAKFTNSPQGLEGALKKNYVGFSFDYPSNWEYKREAGGPNASNFIKVENALRDKAKGDFTLENFAVGYFQSSGNSSADAKLFPQLVKQLSAQFAGFPHFQKLSEGATKINNYSGYEFRFGSRFDKTKYADVGVKGESPVILKSFIFE
jgi:hypothetical protein